MADERQPGRTTTELGSRMLVFGEDTPDHSIIDIDPERLVDLLRYPWTSIRGFRRFISTMARMSSEDGAFWPGLSFIRDAYSH